MLTSIRNAQAVFKEVKSADIVIMTAAVADFRPIKYEDDKIKKQSHSLLLELEKTTDILYELGKKKGNKLLAGFALETEHGLEHAKQKLNDKNLDLIVLNNPHENGAGFKVDSNKVTLIDRNENIVELPLLSKHEVAEKILDKIIEML